MIIDIFHPPILGQVNIGLYLEKSRNLRTKLPEKKEDPNSLFSLYKTAENIFGKT
jgi:hypothetical protein